jgi:hypothetical protein
MSSNSEIEKVEHMSLQSTGADGNYERQKQTSRQETAPLNKAANEPQKLN